jgi:hypothetical protein
MRLLTGILAMAAFIAVPAWAQTPATGTPKAPAPAPSASQGGSEAPAPLEKPDPAKETAIRHLMDLTQTSKLGDNISNYISGQVRSVMSRTLQKPDDLQKFMDAFTQKFTVAAPPSAVTDAQVPVYSHYFSMEDIQGLIKFYESPLGQRVVKTLPQVAQQTQQAGMQIDQKAAVDVLRGMSTEYPELKQMLPPEPGGPPNPAPGAGVAPGGAGGGSAPPPRPASPSGPAPPAAEK